MRTDINAADYDSWKLDSGYDDQTESEIDDLKEYTKKLLGYIDEVVTMLDTIDMENPVFTQAHALVNKYPVVVS